MIMNHLKTNAILVTALFCLSLAQTDQPRGLLHAVVDEELGRINQRDFHDREQQSHERSDHHRKLDRR